MASDLESLQAELDAAGDTAATDAPAAEDAATELTEDVTTPAASDEGDDSPALEPEESDPPDSPEVEADSLAFTKWYDARFGRSYAQQFNTDQEFVDALNEKDRLVGHRNEDAQLPKQLRDRIGEDRLKGLLAEEAAPPAKSKPARDANLPHSVDEYMLLQEAASRSDATPAVRDKFAVAQKAFLERLITPATQDTESLQAELAKTISETVAEEMKKHRQTVEEERTQERTTAAEARWIKENRAKLYVDGTRELTPLGKQFGEILTSHPRVKNLPVQVEQWEQALELVELGQPTPNHPRKPSQRSQRQAPVKTGTPKQKTAEERFDEAPSDAAFLQSEWERSQKVAAKP